MLHILRTHIRPVLEYASVVWNTGYIDDLRRLEAVQRLWTRHINGLQNMEYGDRLRQLNLFSVKGRLIRSDLIKCWKIFHSPGPIKPSDLWELSSERRTRGHQLKITVRRCQLDTRSRFFSERVVNEWNALPDSTVTSTSLAEFKSSLLKVLGDRLFDYIV
ncbi:hypothetical protein FJT64_015231 [Amphibalanus amphitrite]|uniref:Uncharacterized protein n=1 Tax=Amphibalanus amphitrite TaxID=1232801 RepID=A0A6A4X4V0_AMPAM|nr:hypothetical protein FJT64_015231 [Amphibalanus amphitrite]